MLLEHHREEGDDFFPLIVTGFLDVGTGTFRNRRGPQLIQLSSGELLCRREVEEAEGGQRKVLSLEGT